MPKLKITQTLRSECPRYFSHWRGDTLHAGPEDCLRPPEETATLNYQFGSVADMVDVLSSFRGPQLVREEMRALARKRGFTLDRCTVTCEVVVRLHHE